MKVETVINSPVNELFDIAKETKDTRSLIVAGSVPNIGRQRKFCKYSFKSLTTLFIKKMYLRTCYIENRCFQVG